MTSFHYPISDLSIRLILMMFQILLYHCIRYIPSTPCPNPIAQKCLPQYFFPNSGNSFCSIMDVLHFNRFTKLLMLSDGGYSICMCTWLHSQLLLESSHSHYYRFVPVNPDTVSEHLLLTHDNDILLPIQGVHLTNLQYVNSFVIRPYCKVRTFIETKVAAINCGDLTHY